MQHPLKQRGDTRLIYFSKRNTFGAYPYPKTIECATSIISEPCLELSPVLKYLCFDLSKSSLWNKLYFPSEAASVCAVFHW